MTELLNGGGCESSEVAEGRFCVWNRGSGERLVVCLGLNGFTPTSQMAALKLT